MQYVIFIPQPILGPSVGQPDKSIFPILILPEIEIVIVKVFEPFPKPWTFLADPKPHTPNFSFPHSRGNRKLQRLPPFLSFFKYTPISPQYHGSV